jgi:hypothetical protein
MQATTVPIIPIGARVRCAYRMPDIGRPIEGTLLAHDDPRAWQGSLAFPGGELPDADAVRAHVASCQARGLLLDDKRPVLWDVPVPYALARKVVYWDSQLVRVTRPTFSRGYTPRDVVDCHAREHCGAHDFPMHIVERDVLDALALIDAPLDGGGNVHVPCAELADFCARLLDFSETGETALGEAAGNLRVAILDCIGIEEI